MKLTTTNVSHAGTKNITRINVTSDRGGPTPVQEPVAEPAPVTHPPNWQHTYADGTTVAPSWSPLSVDHVQTGPSRWNRSYEDSVRQLNPDGDPTDRRGANQPQHLSTKLPKSALLASGPRRKIVGGSATLKPAQMSSVSNDE